MLYGTLLYNSENIATDFNMNSISEPFDTFAVTNGTIPGDVFFASDLRLDVSNIRAKFELANISKATDPDILLSDTPFSKLGSLMIVKNDKSVHLLENGNMVIIPPVEVRYIRDYLNGSSVSVGDHWVEIQALESISGTNRARSSNGATISGSVAQNSTYPYSRIIDGSTNSSTYASSSVNGLQYVQIDLGGLYDIETIKVWHYNLDGRTYHETKTQISTDGITWTTIFDSAVDGEYAETSAGKTMPLREYAWGIDTSPVTNGEVPLNVFLDDGSIFLNSQTMMLSTERYSVLDDGEEEGRFIVFIDKKYDDLVMFTDKIESRVELSHKGNKMVEMGYDIAQIVEDR